MGKTFKKRAFSDRPSGFKKDKSSKYKFHLNEYEDNIDDLVDELSIPESLDGVDSEADSSLFNDDGTRKTREQIDTEIAVLEVEIQKLHDKKENKQEPKQH